MNKETLLHLIIAFYCGSLRGEIANEKIDMIDIRAIHYVKMNKPKFMTYLRLLKLDTNKMIVLWNEILTLIEDS